MRTIVDRRGSIEVGPTGEAGATGDTRRVGSGSHPQKASGSSGSSRTHGAGESDTPDDFDLDALYRRERPGLLRLAYLLVGSGEAAEDVFHDAIASATPHLDNADRPGAYLRTAVVTAANGWHRRAKRAMPAGVEDPSVYLAEFDPRTLELWESLNVLTDRRRAAVVLRYYLDLPVNEIAKHLDCAPSTVSSLLHRAMTDLRKELADD